MEHEKLKIWLDFAKFFFGTVVIGFISLVVKTGFENREMAIKESEQIGQYVEFALREDVGARKRFAEYFKTVSISDNYRDRWTAYYEIVNSEFIKTQLKVEEHGLKIKSLELALDSINNYSMNYRVDNKNILKIEQLLEDEKKYKEEMENKLEVNSPKRESLINAERLIKGERLMKTKKKKINKVNEEIINEIN